MLVIPNFASQTWGIREYASLSETWGIKEYASLSEMWGIREYASLSDGSTMVVRTKQGAA